MCDELHQQLVRRLVLTAGLSPQQAWQVLDEVCDAFGASLDDFITQRHHDLQRQGLTSREIYRQIQRELARWRVAPPSLSLRQIRRRIHG